MVKFSTMQEVFLTILVVLVGCGFALPVDFEGQVLKNISGKLENVTKLKPELKYSLLDKKKHWPEAKMFYTIDPSYTAAERKHIQDAMDEITVPSCIRLKERRNQTSYVRILNVRGKGCSSSDVGRKGGVQIIYLESDVCFQRTAPMGTAIHELLHALGFYHQHMSQNRDKYVQIVRKNIMPGMLSNFRKVPRTEASDYGIGYDLSSVMHYPEYAYAINTSTPTIIPKGKKKVRIGQRDGLSPKDAEKLNIMYECPPLDDKK